tara:strand:- start:346 stop:549 length:204 start_codon:yes stop_codon:yes gene_type:complete
LIGSLVNPPDARTSTIGTGVSDAAGSVGGGGALGGRSSRSVIWLASKAAHDAGRGCKEVVHAGLSAV